MWYLRSSHVWWWCQRFFPYKVIKPLFNTVKTELVKVNHWFKANKLSLDVKKKLIIPFLTNLQLKTI